MIRLDAGISPHRFEEYVQGRELDEKKQTDSNTTDASITPQRTRLVTGGNSLLTSGARRKRTQVSSSSQSEVDMTAIYRELSDCFTAYDAIKRKSSLLDFHDLLSRCVELFRSQPAVADAVHRRFKFVLVDEYQDVNTVMVHFVNYLAKGALYTDLESSSAPPPPPAPPSSSTELTIVGDDDQAIFAWRGAGVQNFRFFAEQYADSKVVPLTKAFRR